MVMLDAAQELPMDWREEEVTSIEEANPRLYVDPNFPLDSRLHKFLDRPLGSIHPLDIVLTSKDWIRDCVKQRSFEGMAAAHEVIDRLLEEKHHFNQLRTPDGNPQPYTFVIAEDIFEVLMYGWAKDGKEARKGIGLHLALRGRRRSRWTFSSFFNRLVASMFLIRLQLL